MKQALVAPLALIARVALYGWLRLGSEDKAEGMGILCYIRIKEDVGLKLQEKARQEHARFMLGLMLGLHARNS